MSLEPSAVGNPLKRAFDCVVAALGLLVTSPILVVAALAIRLDSPGPVMFRQRRVGRHFRPFWIYKFRTMQVRAADKGLSITPSADPRITRVGRVLRRTKVDELPQLFNVLKGDMSFVGPRPEVPEYVEMFRSDYEELLRVRPGITDPASIEFRDEGRLLQGADDPVGLYVSRILPEKIRLARKYVSDGPTLPGDLRLIVQTVLAVVRPHSSPGLKTSE